MPNSYAVSPNIFPGNVQIGGNLTVGGDQLRIGVAAPFVRLGKSTGGNAIWNFNLAFDALSPDNAALGAQRMLLTTDGKQTSWQRFNTAFAAQAGFLPMNLWTDAVNHANTGSITENTIVSKTIVANIFSTNMNVLVRCGLLLSVQGAGNATLRLRIGGVLAQQFAVSALNDYLMETYISIQGAINSNRCVGRLQNLATGAVVGSTTQPNVDFSLDQLFALTLQSANVGDSQLITMVNMQGLSMSGPL